ncbi:MAG: PLP-dependent transferase, partial [Bifidobacteriaceae bacterium]|nr:PLP-dependent transferase [Bifidobacteriaceae bacterium]
GRIVLPTCSYQVGQHFADDLVRRGLASVERVKIDDTEAVIQALDAAPTAMLWLESPTNPMMEVADLPALIGAARARGIVTVVDTTFATPLVQRPLEFGADVVVHSVTKYFAGHSDLVMGAVACASAEFDALVREYRTLHGAIPGPVEAWLALRGMRTMALRVERSQANALELARRLEADPRVAWVRHPGLEKDPGHARAAAQMDGFGSIVTFEPTAGPGGAPDAGGAAGGAVAGGGAPAADAVVAAVRLWTPATSLGGVESTLERRRRFDGESAEVPEGLIRLSVGIEDVEDLWADLDQALAAAA